MHKLPGKLLGFILCLPFKAVGALLRFCLGTKSLKDYVAKRYEEKRLRHVLKAGGKSMALIEAARSGHMKMVETLLQSGVDGSTRDRALITAASGGHVEVCRRLLEAGANVNGRDVQGKTPLIWAAWAGKLPVLRLLLQAGADVNARDHEHGWTPLLALLAEARGEWLYEPAAEALLHAGADPALKGNDGRSALDWARGRRLEKLAHLLGDPSFVAHGDQTHEIFGPISYQTRDEVWLGKCALPRFAECGTDEALSPPSADFRQGIFPLTIHDDTGAGPTRAQASTFQYLKQNEAQACAAVLKALLDSANAQPGPPRYRTAADIKPRARCIGVELSPEHAGGHAYCGFLFRTFWDFEHFTMVVFHPEKAPFCGDETALSSINDAEPRGE